MHGSDKISNTDSLWRQWYRRYWKFGFKTRLYDWLAPEAYLQSLECCVDALPSLEKGETVLDAGCGSGLLIPLLASRIQNGMCYSGTDILEEGLEAATEKARQLGLGEQVRLFRSDLSRSLSLTPGSLSAAIAHFSVYTLAARTDRLCAWRSLHTVLKDGGTLIAANPAVGYDAEGIIHASLEQLRAGQGTGDYWIARFLLYPITLRLGLRYIQRQLEEGHWHAYTLEEFEAELKEAGFSVEGHQTVYGGSGWLIVARKA